MYKTQSADSGEREERLQFEILARMSPLEKARLVTEMSLAVQRLAFAGLRDRDPDASDDTLWLRLAARRLGRDTVLRAYGVDPGDE